jgi:hypothetical protein
MLRPVDAIHGAGEGHTHDRKLDQLLSIRINVGAKIKHGAHALARRPAGDQRRAAQPLGLAQDEHGQRHQRTGIAS